MEVFLHEFHWIQRIQWIMTKSKSGMVTKVITNLLTDTLPVLVIKSATNSGYVSISSHHWEQIPIYR